MQTAASDKEHYKAKKLFKYLNIISVDILARIGNSTFT